MGAGFSRRPSSVQQISLSSPLGDLLLPSTDLVGRRRATDDGLVEVRDHLPLVLVLREVFGGLQERLDGPLDVTALDQVIRPVVPFLVSGLPVQEATVEL